MRATLTVMASLLLAGCEPVSFTKAQPQAKDCVGTYAPTKETFAAMTRAGCSNNLTTSLAFKVDGTFTMLNMPDIYTNRNLADFHGGYESGEGSWKIESNGDGWARRWGIALWFTNGAVDNRMMLRGEKPPYMLHLMVGDPDSGEGLEFEKR
jgi:hypothetical protein